jgi:hypothetical protein
MKEYKSTFMYDESIEEDEFNEEQFKNWLYMDVKYKIENFLDKMQYNYIKNHSIKIYRAMKVDENYLEHFFKDGKRLGIYWAYEENNAEAHWGVYNKPVDVIFESIVNETKVNWFETISLNIDPNFENEKEIRLFKNTPLKIISMELNGEKINIDKLKNRVFYA